MGTYLYGIILVRNADGAPAVTGIAGAAVRVVRCGAIGALVGTVERAPTRGNLDDVRMHDRVLRSVVRQGITTAATRFGQTFDDDDDACRQLAERADRITSILEARDGCVEMRLVLPRKRDASPPSRTVTAGAGPGRAYLETLQGGDTAEAVAARLEGLALGPTLGSIVRDERVEEMRGEDAVVYSHLVARQDEAGYRASVHALPGLADARVIGPLPLYSFAEPGL